MKWLLVFQEYCNDNTKEYGFGDFPEYIDYLAAVIEADTLRKAQAAAKKLYPRIRFGGIRSPMLIEANDKYARLYTKAADARLNPHSKHLHRQCLAQL